MIDAAETLASPPFSWALPSAPDHQGAARAVPGGEAAGPDPWRWFDPWVFGLPIPRPPRRRQEFGMSLQVGLFVGIIMVAFLLRVYIEYLEDK